MIVNRDYDQILVARLEEYWTWFTPWQRRLWNTGTIAAISELLEECESASLEVLKQLKEEVARLIGPDVAVGDQTTRRVLHRLVTGDLAYRRVGWHTLRELRDVIKDGYIGRWAKLLRQDAKPGAERVARSVAGHLLHAGFSSHYLHRWLRYQTQHRTDLLSAADLLDEAERELVGKPEQSFKVLVPVISTPDIAQNPPSQWLTAAQVADLIENVQGRRTELRQNGGFLIPVTARDVYAAVAKAKELLDRWAARAELATRKGILRLDQCWVEGHKEAISLKPEGRGVDIGALERENKIYALLDDDPRALRIDDAMQLVQPMESGSRSAAISGGWAAIEALLTVGEAKSTAARRLAGIIACSFPRAELTTLSYRHAEHGNDALAAQLRQERINLRRARIVADALTRGERLAGRGAADQAACVRMREVLENPYETLNKVRDYVEAALDRLYRQRNLILHGGRVSGEHRTETLATVPPLVGAGLDRIAHAWFTEGTTPIELAARADLSLHLVGSAAGRHVTELLRAKVETDDLNVAD